MFNNCKIVLVRTQFAGNIGSTARVMKNLGFSKLVLVNPKANHLDEEAKRLSCQGEDILTNATKVDSIEAAVADSQYVAATSCQAKGLVRDTISRPIRNTAKDLSQEINRSQSALIFGPESSGLTTNEISICNLLIKIPTSEDYPALNLAMAAGIVLYEIKMASLETESPSTDNKELATWQMQQKAFDSLKSSLEEIRFLFSNKSKTLFNGIKNMISRSNPTTQEMKWLIGLNRQIKWHQLNKNPETKYPNHPPQP